MFGESYEGRIHQLLNKEYSFAANNNANNEKPKCCRLMILFCFNEQLCHQFCLRHSGTNIYLCDRILLFLFIILLTCIISLCTITFYCSNYSDGTKSIPFASIFNNEALIMFGISVIILIIYEKILHIFARSRPDRLDRDVIDMLLCYFRAVFVFCYGFCFSLCLHYCFQTVGEFILVVLKCNQTQKNKTKQNIV